MARGTGGRFIKDWRAEAQRPWFCQVCGTPVAKNSSWCGSCQKHTKTSTKRPRLDNPSQALDEIVGPEASKALEEYYGNDVRRVFQATPEELSRLMLGKKRLTKKQISQILLAGKAINDHLSAAAPRGKSLHSAADIRDWFLRTTDTLEVEEFWVVAVDQKNVPYQKVFISRGTLNMALVHPREVFTPLLRGRAAGFFCVHNHPTGDPTPSAEDIELTKRLIVVAGVVGIRVLDHVVIGKGGQYRSFQELGILTQ